MGGIGFDGSDGGTSSDVRQATAAIIAFASESHGTSDKGGRLTFWTSPNNKDQNTDATERLRIDQNGVHYVGGDMWWRDGSVTGTILATVVDDNDDGRFRVYENGVPSVDLDANTQFVFNEQGLDRDFRIESDTNQNMFKIDAANSRIGIRESNPQAEIHLTQSGTSSSGPAGMRFQSSTTYWKLFHSGVNFSFSDDGIRVAYVENGTGNYIITSDRSFKKNITSITSVLEKITELRPVSYHYNSMKDNEQKAVGFVAQEVEAIFPEIVRQSEDGMKALSYSDFAVLSVKAIQEQQEIIESQDKEIKELKDRLDKIEKLLSSK